MGAADRTKQALAQALKELMSANPLEKISVGDITRQAQMGRNTFYYHFKDKYDLVNWIFETESGELMRRQISMDNWADFLNQIEEYIRRNLSFYRNALEYSGQNSLQDYIYDVLEKRLTELVRQVDEERQMHMRADEIAFTAGFFASALQGLLIRSIRKGIPPEMSHYRECVRRICSGEMIVNYLNISGRQQKNGAEL